MKQALRLNTVFFKGNPDCSRLPLQFVRLITFLLLIIGATAVAQAAESGLVTVDSFKSPKGSWSASAGKVRTTAEGGNMLVWSYPLSKKAAFIMSRSHMDRLRGAESFLLRIRSDRAGELAFRLDYPSGSAFWTKFPVGKKWTTVELPKTRIKHVFNLRKLDPDKVGVMYLVDLSGQDEGWRGKRTVWVDYIRVRSKNAVAVKPDPVQEVRIESQTAVPANRPFYLCMTPWPYDLTPGAIAETYTFLKKHTDMVGHHFDDGVPWQEALEQRPYHAKVRENLDYRVKQLPGWKVYLIVTPISWGRDRMAAYWGKEANRPRAGKWKRKKFDDPETIDAYVNFCRTLIKKFKPVYLTYGIEVNMLRARNKRAFDRYVNMTAKVYPRLKKEFPNLPMGLTFHVGTYAESPSDQRAVIEKLLPYMDFIGVSSYPYGEANRGRKKTFSDPKFIPTNWFRQIRDIAPDKPFAIAETGFIAEPFESKQYRVSIPGNDRWQAKYMEWLLQEAHTLNAEFVMWFVSRDYDQGWKRLKKMGFDDVAKTWKDTGLVDHAGRNRPALDIWRKWMKTPKRR